MSRNILLRLAGAIVIRRIADDVEYLRTYRLSTGRNLRQFGEYLGVTPQCVSQWEQGRYVIRTWALKLIYALRTIEELRQPKLPLPIPAGKCQCNCGGDTILKI